jgi:transcriptional regulator with XRE-family HTH domain
MIGDKIRKAREEKRYSQDYLAAYLDLNQSTYCRIESGRIKPSVQQIIAISKLLDVSLDELTNENQNSD